MDEKAQEMPVQTTPQPAKSPKRIILILVGILVLALIGFEIFAINYLTASNKTVTLTSAVTPTLKPSPTPLVPMTFYSVPFHNAAQTKNWKTYKSAKYPFTFSYPPHLYANESTALDMVLLTTETKPVTNDEFTGNQQQQSFNVSVKDKKIVDALFADSVLQAGKVYWQGFSYQHIIIDGKKGRIASGYAFIEGKKVHMRILEIPYKDKHVVIDYDELTLSLEDFNLILSTFKFTP